MVITHLGKQFFKITQGDLTIGINPSGKDRFGADVAFVSINHSDYNSIENLSHGDRVPFVIDSAGDYEVKDIIVKGVNTEIEIKNKKYINKIYSFELDGIKICFLGALSNSSLSNETKEALGNPDLLFTPVGESETLGARDAYKLAVSLEAKIIIPMDYTSETLKIFLKEAGAEKVAPVDKLALKRKDLDGKEADVCVIE